MWLKVRPRRRTELNRQGGSRIWGDESGAPDDCAGMNTSYSHIYRFAPGANVVDTVAGRPQHNLTMCVEVGPSPS